MPDMKTAVVVDVDQINMDFPWQALPGQSFRILNLDAGHDNSPLSGQLEVASLEGSADYDTISYAWGDREPIYSIRIDGHSLSITQRVSKALRRARDPLSSRRLWIDAVCIDQTNAVERGNQVASMQDIFAGAAKNIVYLGPPDETTAAGIAAVKDIMASVSEERSKFSSTRGLFYDKKGQLRGPRRNYPIPSRLDDEALHRLYNRGWFRRLWVVQEAALSPYNECLCGTFTVSLYDLLAAAAWYRLKNFRLHSDHSRAFRKAFMMFDLIYADRAHVQERPRIQYELAYYLHSSRHFIASERKDYVFALRGLLKDSKDARFIQLLEPDYSESVTAEQVFTRAFKACMLEMNSIVKPLRRVNHFQESDVRSLKLPSWVINLARRAISDKARMIIADDFSDRLRAHRGSPKQLELPAAETDELHVKGILLGSVDELGPAFERGSSPGQAEHFVIDSARVAGRIDFNDRCCNKARKFAMTLIGGVNSRGLLANVSAVDAFFSWVIWIHNAEHWDDRLPGKMKHTDWRSARGLHHAVERACSARRLFRAHGALFGLGPTLMRKGDVIVLLYEADLPCILRPTEDAGRFHFVGSCYVDDVMKGEAHGRWGESCRTRDFRLI
jgi:hypothetical protein